MKTKDRILRESGTKPPLGSSFQFSGFQFSLTDPFNFRRSAPSGLLAGTRQGGKREHIIKNEGTSHDVIENKATENEMLEHPTIFMKTNDLLFISHDVYGK